MKWFKRLLIALVVLLVVALVASNFYLGHVVKAVVENAGPSLVGAPLQLESAQFRLLQGIIRLNGFVLGNPEGFKTDKAIGVGRIGVDIDMRSLLSDTIRIKRILIEEPEIVYEMGLGKSNIGKILDGLGGEEAGDSKKEEKPGEKETGKKVVIEDLLIKDAKVRVSMTVAQGLAAPVPLPDIRLTNIGAEEGEQGASPVEVIRRILGAIVGAVGKVVTGAAGLVGDGAQAVGGAAVDAGRAVGDTVGDGARAVGGAVGEGASRIVGGVRGLVIRDSEESESPGNRQGD